MSDLSIELMPSTCVYGTVSSISYVDIEYFYTSIFYLIYWDFICYIVVSVHSWHKQCPLGSKTFFLSLILKKESSSLLPAQSPIKQGLDKSGTRHSSSCLWKQKLHIYKINPRKLRSVQLISLWVSSLLAKASCWGQKCQLNDWTKAFKTWQSFGPLDGRDELAAAQPVEGGHEASGGVSQAAVITSINGVWLNGFQQRQHGGHQLGHGLGHQRPHLLRRSRTQLGRIHLLHTL